MQTQFGLWPRFHPLFGIGTPRRTCSCTPATGILSLITQVKWLNGTGKENGRLNNELRMGVNE